MTFSVTLTFLRPLTLTRPTHHLANKQSGTKLSQINSSKLIKTPARNTRAIKTNFEMRAVVLWGDSYL